MQLERLSPDLSAALEDARRRAERRGSGYIQPKHLLLALLDDGGALERALGPLGLRVAHAYDAVGRVAESPGARLEPGRQPLAGRALRDLLDAAERAADQRGYREVGPGVILLAAARGTGGEVVLGHALRDAGFTVDRIRAALDEADGVLPAASAGAAGSPGATRDVGFGTPPNVRGGATGNGDEQPATPAASDAAPSAAAGPLSTYARDLTALARAGELPPVVGREDETLQVIQTLLRRTKNNPVLVGDPGVGKTAVVEGLAQRIADGRVPTPLKNARLLALDLTALVAGAKYRGEFEERLKGVIDEVRASKDVVLFLDEVHTLVGAGGSEGGMDAANMLKPALARGELRCIGATTHDEYRERIARDGALARRFEPVTVDEPDDAAVRRMLEGAKGRFEQHHGVRYTPDALDAIVKLARRHLRDRAFPDKAFDVLDEAAARVVLAREGTPAGPGATPDGGPSAEPAEVTAADVAAVVGRRARVPVSRLLEGERERLLALDERLGERVFGQDEAVAMAADAARRMRADLRRVRKPASFLFVGPTGTGKTELAKALAEALFDDERALVRIDMAEYKESHAVSGLIGSRPGLVGSEKGGFLTEQVRRNPNSVVLFDEVEKAHPEVIDILLGVLDEGRLTDAQGRLCDFTNTLIILTSNLGVREATQAAPNDPEVQRQIILKVVQASLRPELFNRIGAVVPFSALGTDVLARIVRKQLAGVGSRLSEEYGAGLQADADAVARLAELAYDPSYGARPVERTVERLIVSDLSRSVLAGDVQAGSLVCVVREGDGVLVLAGPPAEVEAEAAEVRAENARVEAARAADAASAEAAAAEVAGAAVTAEIAPEETEVAAV